MRRKLSIVISVVIVAIGAFLLVVNTKETDPNEVNSTDIKKLVNNYSVGNIEGASASITPEELIVTDKNGTETTYELPEEEFFVSIAPYIETTHPCAIHSLTGCQGELSEKEVDVYIEDSEGNVVIDKTMTTQENGFIDLWLPRNKTYTTTIEYDGKSAQSEFSTYKGDNTCITTIQLVAQNNA